MSAVENNLIDFQSQASPKHSLSHYQHAEKKCISLQILPYSRPYVVPLSKVLNGDSFVDVVSSLPEVPLFTVADTRTKFLLGNWRIIDEAGLVIRFEDWGELVGPGAKVIIDMNGDVSREAERLDTAPAAATEKQKAVPAEANGEAPKVQNGFKSEELRAPSEEPEEPEELEEESQEKGKQISQIEVSEKLVPIEEPAEPQGDPEWTSWNTSHQASPPDAADDWNTTGPVPSRVDDGWGTSSSTTAQDNDWGSSSTFQPRENNGYRNDRETSGYTTRFPRQSDSSSAYSSHKPYTPKNNKPWQVTRSTSPVGYSKIKFPKKVHLTFYAPFQLPRGVPPTPHPPYNRFSVLPDTPMHQVALKVLSRPPFSNMPTPGTSEFEPENHVFVFLELREVEVGGKRRIEKGRTMKVLGRTSMRDMGLSTEGGFEGIGRYYFIVKDFFAEGMDMAGIE
ncbi:hypothetical protein TWF281_007622 [Arthrobotrys megalospora]